MRGQKIVFDFDLTQMNEVENRALKQSIKRNIDRFRIDFMFQLTKTDWQELITNCDNLPQNIKELESIYYKLFEDVYEVQNYMLQKD